MSKNAAFAFASQGGSTSWADDDDMDLPTIPLKGSAPPATMEQKSPRQERKYSEDESAGRHHHHHRGVDRRSGRDEQPRQKNPVPDEGPFKLFVGNLPFSLNEDQLAEFLGNLSIKSIRFPKEFETGRPKGFAYIEFDDRESLVKALELDGHELMSRHVKMDVAVERERKPRNNNSWYDKRGNGGHHDRPHRRRDENEAPIVEDEKLPKERPKLSLLPRSTSTETDTADAAAKKASIFGEAKPRDEALYLERQKSRELEKKKPNDETEKKIERSTSGGRKHSDDFTRGGRGGRGGRGNKHESGRGDRGELKGGRGGKVERQSSKEKDAPAKKQQEARPKSVQQVTIAAPSATKTKNMFDLLDSDSDD